MTKKYTFEIEAQTEREADELAKALDTIYRKVKNEDLVWVAGHLQKNPNVINQVKNVANNPLVKKMFFNS